jgi:hypothetical protein
MRLTASAVRPHWAIAHRDDTAAVGQSSGYVPIPTTQIRQLH